MAETSREDALALRKETSLQTYHEAPLPGPICVFFPPLPPTQLFQHALPRQIPDRGGPQTLAPALTSLLRPRPTHWPSCWTCLP